MKKTSLQKLIEFMDQNQYFIGNDLYSKQKELLKEEKEMVIDAYHQGQLRLIEILIKKEIGISNPNTNPMEDAEEYFKEKFEQ
jgi:hypothetical protein